jgi:hypothetical protein
MKLSLSVWRTIRLAVLAALLQHGALAQAGAPMQPAVAASLAASQTETAASTAPQANPATGSMTYAGSGTAVSSAAAVATLGSSTSRSAAATSATARLATVASAPVASATAASTTAGSATEGSTPTAFATAASTSTTSTTTQGNVAELLQMIHDSALTELRTTYNGGYGASLFFYPDQLTYYVALFQNKHFWRVIKSQDVARAEAVYADFARQTAQLAEVEIRRTQLEAQKAFIERVIALSEDRARRLQADIDVAQTQQAKVSDYQRQVQGEALTLRSQNDKAQAQLRTLQDQVQQLQRQAEAGLPPTR